MLYVITGSVWMLTGLGGAAVTHYVGLFSDAPAALVSFVICAAAALALTPGALRAAWISLAVALAMQVIGNLVAATTWVWGHDPFPGPADIFFCAFYPALGAAALFLIRAAAVRVPWMQLSLDATIFVVGFGAFFWFLVIHPATMNAEVGLLKEALSQAYVALDCIVLLMLGVRLLTGAGNAGGQRVPLLILSGFATMFLADILWSLAKVRGYYLPGGLQDVLYVSCYVPIAAAAREQMRAIATAGAHGVEQLGRSGAGTAARGNARGVPGAGVLRPRRHRRPGDRHDHGRVRAHAAADGAAGRGAARGRPGARAARGAHGRGPLRLAHRQRLGCHHDRRRRRDGALRLARRRAHPGTEARGDHRQEPARAVGRRGR